jgi:GTP cyclohydrolase II
MRRQTPETPEGLSAVDGPPRRLQRLARRLAEPESVSPDGRLVVDVKTELPTEHGTFDVRLFHFDSTSEEHLAISCGELTGAPLAVRIHSECFTGEVLGSQKCDCDAQLGFALEKIQDLGRGLVVYLRQEGRGIGLANKLRAYALQNAGADTVDANRLLGLPDDNRRYDAAAAILQHLGVSAVRLMTNNPLKVEASTALAAAYLRSKRDRLGHHVPAHFALRVAGS